MPVLADILTNTYKQSDFTKEIDKMNAETLNNALKTLDSTKPNVLKTFLENKSGLAEGKKRYMTRKLERSRVNNKFTGLVKPSGVWEERVITTDACPTGDCLLNAVYQALLGHNLLDNIATLSQHSASVKKVNLTGMDVSSESKFIESVTSVLDKNKTIFGSDLLTNLSKLLLKFNILLKEVSKGSNYKELPLTRSTTETPPKVYHYIYLIKPSLDEKRYKYLIIQGLQKEKPKNTRKLKGVHGFGENYKENLKWKFSSEIKSHKFPNKTVLQSIKTDKPYIYKPKRGTIKTIQNISNENKKYYINLDIKSPESGSEYNANDGNIMHVIVKSHPKAEIEIIDLHNKKVMAVYYDINGTKYTKQIDIPKNPKPCPDKFAKYGDKEATLSFELSLPPPEPPTGTTQVDQLMYQRQVDAHSKESAEKNYRFTYTANIFLDKDMKPFVWYLNIEELKIPIYLIKES
jgi:hypothetical protein